AGDEPGGPDKGAPDGDDEQQTPHRHRRILAHGLDIGRFGGILKRVLNRSATLDLAFQALADPSRRAMLERLSRGPASVSELARPLPMSLPAVVQHLQVLEASGLVR